MRHLVVLIAVALVACGGPPGPSEPAAARPADIDFARSPGTVFHTDEFEVGETYTLGVPGGVPEGVKRPYVITGVELVASNGVEVIGRGVVRPEGESMGLAPGWPPPPGSFTLDLEAIDEGRSWDVDVTPILGIRTLEPKSGLRGVTVSWIDADGARGSATHDLAVQTCAPGACDRDPGEGEWLLEELDLLDS